MFLMDYANRRRIEIWEAPTWPTRCRVDCPTCPPGVRGDTERTIVFQIDAWGANCPQHIPQCYAEDEGAPSVHTLRDRIAALEAENRAVGEGMAASS